MSFKFDARPWRPRRISRDMARGAEDKTWSLKSKRRLPGAQCFSTSLHGASPPRFRHLRPSELDDGVNYIVINISLILGVGNTPRNQQHPGRTRNTISLHGASPPRFRHLRPSDLDDGAIYIRKYMKISDYVMTNLSRKIPSSGNTWGIDIVMVESCESKS